ncbi:hypothetical protein SETIT_9G382400v2 [Setaria italica]|uniref:Protein kinase domain-containing protein n=1 Tax=Setaria italica TaxID=4555 RepID=A0A368SQ71_SETIT|nr:hypothetical protein SETIT_9G382400v2 [Setaria italica]
MFDAEITSKDNMKIFESIAKLAGECLTMEDKRPEMIDVAERLRVLRKASHQDQLQQRADLFSWVRKSKPAPSAASTIPAKILPSNELYRQFLLVEMKAVTNNFHESHVIGRGGCGRVYLGKIDGGQPSLIQVTSKLRHGNLVPLIGYCHTKEEMLLVYEYMARGNLQEYLYVSGTQGRSCPISWTKRMETCIGAARGLRYLHESQIIHGDVKTANILLDEEWLAKITDLILPDSREFVTMLCGTVGYLDPEYMMTCQLTEKSEVYSFGVVLLEVLCARPAFSREDPDEEASTLVAWALRCKVEGNLDQIVDPYLKGKINPQCLDKFVNTAEKCLAPKGTDRPSMGDVILDLEYALQLQGDAEASKGPACSMSDDAMYGDGGIMDSMDSDDDLAR